MSDVSTQAPPPEVAPSRLRLTLVLGTLTALGPLSIDMYLPSFPSLARSLGVSVASVQLTLATYLAGMALGQLLYGPLSDRLGRRVPLLAGLGLYAGASLACAGAGSLEVLAAGRFVQALGGCAGLVLSRAVVRDHFDVRASASLYSSLMLVMGVAPILAPLLGGQVLHFAGWRALFIVLALAGLALLTLVALSLPESHPHGRRTRYGLAQSLRGMGTLLTHGRFVRLALAGGASQAAMFAYIAGSPFVFIQLFGVPPERYGFLFGTNAFGLILASQLNRWLAPRLGVERVLRGALVLATLAYVGMWLAARSGAGLPVLLPPLFVGIASVGLTLPNATAAAMAPYGAQAGSASALFGTLQMGCGALAAAAVSALADGTARPMATVMLGVTVLALLLVAVEGGARAAART